MLAACTMMSGCQSAPDGSAARPYLLEMGQLTEEPPGHRADATHWMLDGLRIEHPPRDRAGRRPSNPRLILRQGEGKPAVLENAVDNGLTFRFVPLQHERRAGRPAIFMMTLDMAGTHCCIMQSIAIPTGASDFTIVELPPRGGDFPDRLPGDVSGDGRIDFIQPDRSFEYAFGSHASHQAPSMIFNIVDGALKDVSGDSAFRPYFAREAAVLGERCVPRRQRSAAWQEGDTAINQACAAYVAAAIRGGARDAAWSRMLSAYRPMPDGGNFVPKLTQFLKETGYLARDELPAAK